MQHALTAQERETEGQDTRHGAMRQVLTSSSVDVAESVVQHGVVRRIALLQSLQRNTITV
jgi:hypothetical protein